jgi:hypothetical protein
VFRELDRRVSGDDVIALFWDDERKCAELVIDRCGETWTRQVPPNKVADALRHPYVYLPKHLVPTAA